MTKALSPSHRLAAPPAAAWLPYLDHDTVPQTALMKALLKATSMKRGHGSMTEAVFVAWLVRETRPTMIDAAGNIHCDRRMSSDHTTMFTAHTDSVHHEEGYNPILVDGNFWRASEGSALGADDGAGIALMLHMMAAEVPGYYLFLRGEECGGLGSSWLAKEMPQAFKGVDRAIAFDRAGYSDVITHQRSGRCCSDAFAIALADALTADDLSTAYSPDSSGVFTDTDEFIHLVPECTNVSVGYKNQHGDREEQDVEFLNELADQLVLVAWDKLPTVRDPSARERKPIDWHTSWGPMPTDQDFDDGEEDDSVCTPSYLLGLLEETIAGDISIRHIIDQIATVVHPEAPDEIAKNIQARKLTLEVLNAAIDVLIETEDVCDVLHNLYELAAIQ